MPETSPVPTELDPILGQVRRPKLSEEFAHLQEICKGQRVTYLTLVRVLRERGHALITLFFCFPFMLPVPVPGLSVLFGAVICYAGVRMMLGLKPWLPRRWLKRPLPINILIPVLKASEKVLARVEKIVKPRGKFFAHHPWSHAVSAGMIAFCGLLLALPLPPGTNFPPGLCVVFLSIGLLEEDGLFLALGWLAFAVNLAFFAGLFLLGMEGVKRLFF